MSLTVGELNAHLRLNDAQFNRGLTMVQAKFGKFGKFLTSGSLLAGAAVVGIGVKLFKLGEEFDTAYDNIRIGNGATG